MAATLQQQQRPGSSSGGTAGATQGFGFSKSGLGTPDFFYFGGGGGGSSAGGEAPSSETPAWLKHPKQQQQQQPKQQEKDTASTNQAATATSKTAGSSNQLEDGKQAIRRLLGQGFCRDFSERVTPSIVPNLFFSLIYLISLRCASLIGNLAVRDLSPPPPSPSLFPLPLFRLPSSSSHL